MSQEAVRRRARADCAARIHPAACVDPRAVLGAGVEVGPYAIIEAGARIGDRTIVMAHAYICGSVTIAADCEVHIAAVLGHTPQIRGLAGETGGLQIGPRTIVREHATIHRSSRADACTIVGADVLLLGYTHVGHDCQIGDGVTIANATMLSGMVTVGANAFLSGNIVVHQHVRIGEVAMIGGSSRVVKDVPPFMMAVGESRVRGLNVVGMRRVGLPPEARQRVRRAFTLLYRSGLNVSDAVRQLQQLPPAPEITALIDFIETSRRGICGGPKRRYRSDEVDLPTLPRFELE